MTNNGQPAASKQRLLKARKRSLVDVVLNAVAPTPVRNLVAKFPRRYRKLLLIVMLAASVVFVFRSTLLHVLGELYGPDVRIGIADTAAVGDSGSKSLLYEFVFDKAKFATPVTDSGDVSRMFDGSPAVMLKPECQVALGERSEQKMHVYQLVVVVQNSGDRTARDYEAMISFSSKDIDKPDPGIRILGSSVDALTVGYLYQQESNDSITAALKLCKAKAIETYRADIIRNQPDSRAQIPQLTRDMYRTLGLTRDFIILSGTLEAHLFQAATLLIAVPVEVSEFATIFHVECENCSFFYRTMSFGETVGLARSGTQIEIE